MNNEEIFKTMINKCQVIEKIDHKSIKLTSVPYKEHAPVSNNVRHGYLKDDYLLLHSIFSRTFRIIEAGRSKATALKNIYTYPNLQSVNNEIGVDFNISQSDIDHCSRLTESSITRSEETYIPLNCSEKNLNKFINEIINLSKDCFENNLGEAEAANLTRFIMIGDVGIGKSQCLNYLFSINHETLRANKIIWIRVDLTKDSLKNLPLDVALKFQLCRIIREQYEEDIVENNDFFNSFDEYIKEYASNEKFCKTSYYNSVFEFLFPFEKDRAKPYSIDTMNSIKNYIENKYPIIYILDGLDRTVNNSNEFDIQLKTAREYIFGNGNNKNIFILVMRSTSHADYIKYLGSRKELDTGSSLRYPSKVFKILPVDLSGIIKNRIDYITKNWHNISDDFRYRVADVNATDYGNLHDNFYKDVSIKFNLIKNKLTWISTSNLKLLIKNYLMFIYKGISLLNPAEFILEWNDDKCYIKLCSLIGTNTRTQLNIVIKLFDAYLLAAQSVKVNLETIINNMIQLENYLSTKDNSYNIQHFRSYLSKNHNALLKIFSKSYLTMRVLLGNSSSYTHPYHYYMTENNNFDFQKHPYAKHDSCLFNLFHGTNTLNNEHQHYHLLAKVRILQYLLEYGHQDNKDYMLQKLAINFAYNRKRLDCDFRELREKRLILKRASESPPGSDSTFYYISKYGESMVKHVIYEYSYLRLVSIDILIPLFTKTLFTEENKFFSIKDNARLLINDFKRVLILHSIIKHVETSEIETTNNQHDIPKHKWKISDKLYISLKNTFLGIISNTKTKTKDSIIFQLNS